jgi:hypothetical protein
MASCKSIGKPLGEVIEELSKKTFRIPNSSEVSNEVDQKNYPSSSTTASSPKKPPSSLLLSLPDTSVSSVDRPTNDPLMFPSEQMLSDFFYHKKPKVNRVQKIKVLEWLHELGCEEWQEWTEYYEAHETLEEKTERLEQNAKFNRNLARHKLEWARIKLEALTNKTFPEATIAGEVNMKKLKKRNKSAFTRAISLKPGKTSPVLENNERSGFEPVPTLDGIEEAVKSRSFGEVLLLQDPLLRKGVVKFGNETGLRSSWTVKPREESSFSNFEREVISQLEVEIEMESALENSFED